ncbi:MAG: cyclodeaminase/cyclohydrolase family protein [Firmicutes bacterium]|nr:cyclodeaminase/cyclohydrolase family protein [Bacillota bacterium]
MENGETVRDRRLEAFVADLASDRPVPGGGAAAAVALAMARALLAMAAAVSARRAPEGERVALEADAAVQRQAAIDELSLADRDMEAFGRVLAAMRARRSGGEEGARAAEVAAEAAVGVGEQAAEAALAALRAAGQLAGRVRPAIAGDVLAAVALADATLAVAVDNMAANADLLADGERAVVRRRAEGLRRRGRALAATARRRAQAAQAGGDGHASP